MCPKFTRSNQEAKAIKTVKINSLKRLCVHPSTMFRINNLIRERSPKMVKYSLGQNNSSNVLLCRLF